MDDTGFIQTKRLTVDVQENGIIRRASDGYIIGRLAHDGDPSYEELIDEGEAITALREENARKDKALKRIIARAKKPGKVDATDAVYCFMEAAKALSEEAVNAALAAQAPEAKGESGEAAPAREQGEESVAKTVAGAVHAYIHESIDDFDGTSYSRWELEDVVSRALLARKPAESIPIVFESDRAEAAFGRPLAPIYAKPVKAKSERGEVVDWNALKNMAEDHFEIVARHAREGKRRAIEAGDIDEAQCFDCEIKTLGRGFDCWLAARALLARNPTEEPDYSLCEDVCDGSCPKCTKPAEEVKP